MGTVEDKLRFWPRTRSDEPIFKTSEEAIFYATLIHTNKILIGQIRKIRKETVKTVRGLINARSRNLDRIMHLAVKGQFARECSEEIQRLQDIDIQSKAKGQDRTTGRSCPF